MTDHLPVSFGGVMPISGYLSLNTVGERERVMMVPGWSNETGFEPRVPFPPPRLIWIFESLQ